MEASRWTTLVLFIVAACDPGTPTTSPSPVGSSTTPGQTAPAPTASPTLPGTPTATPTASPGAAASDRYGRWESAGALAGLPLQAHVLPFGTTAIVVGSDNVCTPGTAWPESVAGEVWGGGAEPWTAAPDLPRARDRFVAFPLRDGSVLIVGGLSNSGPKSFRSTYRLTPGATEWERSGDLNSARSGPAGAVLQDGRILVAGGWYADLPDAPHVVALASAELFDPVAQAWSRTGRMAHTRIGASATTLTDGRVLIAGGWGEFDDQDPAAGSAFAEPLASTEIFDPATGTFTTSGSLPWTTSWAPLVPLADGDALIVSRNRAARFDGASGQWTETPPMGFQLEGRREGDWVRVAVGLPGGEVLVAGGSVQMDLGEEGSTAAYSARAEVYDPLTNGWIEITPMPVARTGAAGVRLPDGSVLIAGGAGSVGFRGDPYCPGAALEAVRFIPS